MHTCNSNYSSLWTTFPRCSLTLKYMYFYFRSSGSSTNLSSFCLRQWSVFLRLPHQSSENFLRIDCSLMCPHWVRMYASLDTLALRLVTVTYKQSVSVRYVIVTLYGKVCDGSLWLGIAIPGSGIPGYRTVFQSRNPGIMRDQIPGFLD